MAFLLLSSIFLLDAVVFLIARAKTEIGKQRHELERMLLELIAVVEKRKVLKEVADSYTDEVIEDHRNLLQSYYDLQSMFIEVSDRVEFAEGKCAEALGVADGDRQKMEDSQHQAKLAEKAQEKAKENALYWKKTAMGANASWRQWSKDAVQAKKEAREMRAEVAEMKVAARKRRALVRRLVSSIHVNVYRLSKTNFNHHSRK